MKPRSPFPRACAVVALAFAMFLPSVPAEPKATAAETAKAVLAAHAAGDKAKLASLAAQPRPDRWRVADELLAGGHGEAATAYVADMKGAAVAKLATYVARTSKAGDDAAAREALASMITALKQKQFGKIKPFPLGEGQANDTVTRVRMLQVLAAVAKAASNAKDRGLPQLAAARAARDLGWIERAVGLYRGARAIADQPKRNPQLFIQALEECAPLRVELGDIANAAGNTIDVGFKYIELRQAPKAKPFAERGAKLAKQSGNARLIGMSRLLAAQVAQFSGDGQALARALHRRSRRPGEGRRQALRRGGADQRRPGVLQAP